MADFRREYGIGNDELWAMGSFDFAFLLVGLSDRSRYRRVASDEPEELSDAAARRAMGG